jgi:DNA polymerase-1
LPQDFKLDIPSASKSYGNDANKLQLVECCFAATATMRAMQLLEPSLKQKGMWDLFHFVEMPLCRVLGDMEFHGVPVDSNFYTQLRQDLNDRTKTIECHLSAYAGADFNHNSPRMVAALKANLISLQRNKSSQLHEPSADHLSIFDESTIDSHPLLQMVSELRLFSRLIPTCSSILAHRFKSPENGFDRVR